MREECSGSHYFRKTVLEQLILDDLNQTISAFQLNVEKLLKKIKTKFDIQESKKQANLRNQLTTAQKRTKELDTIIQKLYEKQLLDEMSTERLRKLCDSYEAEQAELNKQIQESQAILDAHEVVAIATSFIEKTFVILSYHSLEHFHFRNFN